MTRMVVVAAAFLALAVPASGQEAFVRATTQRFTFGNPAGVGMRSYAMTATNVGVTVPVLPWLAAGTALGYAQASMGSRGISTDVSGMTDVDVFAVSRAGPLRVRGDLALGTGRSTMSMQSNLVAGVAAYDLLPFPVRSWGRGGGYALEAVLPIGLLGFDIELLAGTRSHGTIKPFSDEASSYRLGAERRVALRLGRALRALSRWDVGVEVVLPTTDHVGPASGTEIEAFEPGRRVDLYSAVDFDVGWTSVLARADLYGRRGVTQSVQASDALRDLLGGSATPLGKRRLVAVSVETRTPLGAGMPILTRSRVTSMQGTGADVSWLVTMGLGTDLELRGPWPGRSFVTPTLTMHRGNVGVADGYDSAVGAWELSIGARWEAGR